MASNNDYDTGGVNPKPFLGQPGRPIDPGGVNPKRPRRTSRMTY
jgi:hypothetical protein